MAHLDNSLKKSSACLIALLISALGVSAKLAYHYHVSRGDFSALIFPDEKNYYAAGAELFLKQGWSYFLTPRSLWNAPLSVLWIALWRIDVPLIKVLNVLLLGVAGFLLWDAARRSWGLLGAFLVLLLYNAHLPFFTWGPTILSEPPFCFLLVFSLWLMVAAPKGRFFLCGLLLGLAALIRPSLQFYPLFALLFLGVLWLCSKRLRKVITAARGLAGGLCLLIGFSLPVVPYLVKNYVIFERLVLANGLGAVLYLGNDLRTNGDEPVYVGRDFDTFKITAPYTHLDSEGDRRLMAAARDNFKARPYETILLNLKKPFRFLFGSKAYHFYPYKSWFSLHKNAGWKASTAALFELTLTAMVVILGLAGMVYLSGNQVPRFFALSMVLYFVAVHSPLFPIPRMALPIFPYLLFYGAGSAKILLYLQRRGTQSDC